MNPFAAAIAAARGTPMAPPGPVPGRVLLLDGDGLAYSCAGSDEASRGWARDRVTDFIRSAVRGSGAERFIILATMSGSHKGHRYAIARAKPYQGKRSSGRRPKNWEFLRELIESGALGPVEVTATAEADDRFGAYVSVLGSPNTVICTEDKDMRMIPAWHLNWKEHALFWLDQKTFGVEHNGKLYGEAWFWQQMLMGDTVDNIPGLPFYVDEKGKQKLIGEVTAAKQLADVTDTDKAFHKVAWLYCGYYGERWPVEMLEQACLLWMRRDMHSLPLDCTAPWHPMAQITEHPWAIAEIEARIKEAQDVQAQIA